MTLLKDILRIGFAILCISFGKNVAAQQQCFNNGWEFQKLEQSAAGKYIIRNQGTDWSSQYDVTHIETTPSTKAITNQSTQNNGGRTINLAELQLSTDTIKAEYQALSVDHWCAVRLPHTPQIEPLVVLNQWQGICYYRKTFSADRSWQGKKIFLEFEGAMHLADIWINGQHIRQHAGGYTPFVVDLSEALKYGADNTIIVRLDNRNNKLIPPGKPLESLDFCYYGGIYRDVNLTIKPNIYITNAIQANEVAGGGIFVTYPKVSPEKSVVNVKTHIINATETEATVEVRQHLYAINGLFQHHKRGRKVATSTQQLTLAPGKGTHDEQQITVAGAKLWSPNAPHLYQLVTEIIENGKVIDREETRIGIRHIAFSRDRGFLINGQPLRLVGSNRHMEYPYVGNALSDNAQYRDIHHIRTNGFNIVRLGHYMQDVSVLDACDELGLLAIEPIPGWQFFNKSKLFCELTYRDIRQMIRRDRNHPSIVMWETILNESWPPKEWKDKAVSTAHEEYPGDQCYASGDLYGYEGWDITYNDWQEGFQRPNTSSKPGFIREYYDYEFGGHYSTTRKTRGDGEKALLQNAWNAQWSHNRYRKMYPYTVGDAVWSMYDYNRGCCDNICYSGVADLFRLPKFSLYFYKSQIAPGTPLPGNTAKPMLFIANYWTARQNPSKVIVYSNVDEVELLLNNKPLERRKADCGEDREYQSHATFSGGDVRQLSFPPFTFTNINWQAGTLTAVGYIRGKKVIHNTVRTPEQPASLAIDYFEEGRKAALNDLLIVYVRILDANGTLCVENNSEIRLTVTGGEIQGPHTVNAEAGIASFIVQTQNNHTLNIQAESNTAKESETIKLHQ